MLFDIGDLMVKSTPRANEVPDLFAEKKRAAWKSVSKAVARCDFSPDNWRLNSRGVLFLSLWKASIYGMSLSDIKADVSMPDFFAKNFSDFISRFFNFSISSDSSVSSVFSDWCLITPPPRRHPENNFAVNCARRISDLTGIVFFPDVAKAKNRQRVNAEFELLNIPPANNVICFDDIVTTGSTFQAMRRLLLPLGKNVLFIAGINNKL